MVSQLEYKKRIASTKSLQKIFSAQELIAASRITKARDLALASQPYAEAITKAITEVATYTKVVHPLTAGRLKCGRELTGRIAILCIAADRGMAGSYSATVIRTTEALCEQIIADGKTPVLYTSGRRAASYYQFRGREVDASWEGDSDAPTFDRAVEIADTLVESFLNPDVQKGVDELLIVCTEFVNMVTQRPRIVRMLPLAVDEDALADTKEKKIDKYLLGVNGESDASEEVEPLQEGEIPPLYSFEPGESEVLDSILPRYIRSRVHSCLLEAAASETASRQRAMHTATDNAKDLIQDLVRRANQARQAGITQELTEIVSSADALNSEE
ncbi:MAG: F0F1 ATP synthase subunit gamma [Candidatus Ancillula sp.]|nr:F0F1 ATP synthase subunit gamma [Candidatus Ancillula sp.]